jgi:hypothetical protein
MASAARHKPHTEFMVPSAKPEPVQLLPAKVPNARKAATDAAWESAFASLLEFHRRHGHFHVPKDAEHPHLHYWTVLQRARLSKGAMSHKCRKRLQAAGFPDDPHLLQRRKDGLIWDRHFKKLMDFRRAHGHFDVPGTDANYKALKAWVTTQRGKYNVGRLRPDRHRCLEAFGFPWSAVGSKWQSNWEARFAELAAYQKRFGHCRVPYGWPENSVLARWVSTQRACRKSGKLLPERLARLDQLGFEWKPEHTVGGNDAKWEMRFAELTAYHQRSGHCLVPARWSENPALSCWVQLQRTCRRNGLLKPERIARLDSLGFLWNVVGCPDETWNVRFAELAAFQKRFGHCLVPNYWPENPALALWVNRERMRFSHTRQRQPERIVRLDAIHFVWTGGWKTMGRCWSQKRQAFMSGMAREPHPTGGV